MKISKKLKQYLDKNGFEYKIDFSEHPGCFNEKCSHFIDEIVVWKRSNKVEKVAFSDSSDEFVMKKLEELLG